MIEITNTLLIELLIFVLVFFITFEVLSKFSKNKPVSIMAGLAISLIAVYYINPSQISLLEKTYGITGTIVLTALPSLIAIWFLYYSNIQGEMRKVGLIIWGAFLIIFLQNKSALSEETFTYLITAIIFIIGAIIILDKKIKKKIEENKSIKKTRKLTKK